MKKQISLILCALVIATGFAGCGKKSKDKLTESKADTQSETEVDTIDVGGESQNIPTVDFETGSIISGGKTEKGTNKSDKTDKTDKTAATEDDIPAKGETGTSKEESKESTPTSTAPSTPSSTDKPTGSETSGTSSNSDTQTMDGWGTWQF